MRTDCPFGASELFAERFVVALLASPMEARLMNRSISSGDLAAGAEDNMVDVSSQPNHEGSGLLDRRLPEKGPWEARILAWI